MTIYEKIKSVLISKKDTGPIINTPEYPYISDKTEKEPIYISPIMRGTTDIHPISSMGSKNLSPDNSVSGTSITRFQQSMFNPYDYSLFRNLYSYSEPSFYTDYDESYRQNPFTSMVIEYLMHEVFANDYHFEGPGAKVVEDFFVLDNTREKLKISFREALKKGNGFMDITVKGKKLVRTRVLVPNDIWVDIDSKTGDRVYKQSNKDLKPEYLIHMTVRDEVGVPFGASLLRNNLLFLTGLMDVGGDIMAALKRVAYSPMVAKLDLENLADETEKKKYMDAYSEKLKNVTSATNNFTIDKRHDITLLGQGSAGAKLLPTNDLIEPIISVVLINFGIPLGMFLQTGANKSIIDEQRQSMQRFYEDLRGRIKYYVETKMIPYITGRNTVLVFNKPPITNLDVQSAYKVHIDAYANGLLSKEYIDETWDIDDKGKTFSQQQKGQPTDQKSGQ